MIREFSVENFLSISDRQYLSFLAKGTESELVSKQKDGTLLYKLGIFYGANASGKSNMLLALNSIFAILITPHSNSKSKIKTYVPFQLRVGEPVSMSVSFYANDIRFDYMVSYTADVILSEELYYYPKGSKALFYQRDYVGKGLQANIKFGSTLQLQAKTQASIRENTMNNHSVLSICGKKNYKEDIQSFSSLYFWILKYYHRLDGDDNEEKGLIERLKDVCSDSKRYRFYIQMLCKADLNITAFHPVLEDRYIPESIRKRIEEQDFPEEIKETLLSPTSESIAFENRTNSDVFEIPFALQSQGTIRYLQILGALYDLISGKHVYFLDELGEDLHYDLLYHFLNVFLYNSTNSQLLLTSQETTLLAQDLINENRGVVWLVDKDPQTASSQYNRGDTYGLHKNLSFYNSYRIGRLGAKPELGSFFIM